VAKLEHRPFSPGAYPVVVLGSGPGGLQMSYALSRLGIPHATLSADPAPGGMFRRWPFFQRLLSWTKPFAPPDRRSREYERYDWNSLLADEEPHRAVMPELMDGTSYFPTRSEMERGLVLFAERTGLQVRFGCRWEATRRDGDRFVVITSDGEYRAEILVCAVGMAEPYRPGTPGFEHVPHYADTRPAETYADKRIVIIGKEVSGFELANGLLPWARQIVLVSPSAARLSVVTNSLVGVRARYLQPYEDYVLGGGVTIVNAAIERVVREDGRYVVRTRRSDGGGDLDFEGDEVIAATGFTPALRDLPALGVATFGRNGLPAQTPYWESASVPGIYFAGTITQGAVGLKKHGIPSNSGAVHGARYNARVLARHIARTHFGRSPEPRSLEPGQVADFLMAELQHSPELWHQRSYLARVVTTDPSMGVRDEGIEPLAHFVDASGPDALAVTIEANGRVEFYPALYIRRDGRITERLLEPDPLLRFDTPENRAALAATCEELLGSSVVPTASPA
jgi:thioredoxin reductase